MAQMSRPPIGPAGPPPGFSEPHVASWDPHAAWLTAGRPAPPGLLRFRDQVGSPDGIGQLAAPPDGIPEVATSFAPGLGGPISQRPTGLPPNAYPRLW